MKFRKYTYRSPLLMIFAAALIGLTGCAGHSKMAWEDQYDIEPPPDEFAQGAHQPPSARTLYSMGQILIAQSRDDEAAYIFSRIVREHPTYLPAYNALAEVRVRQHRLPEARSVIDAGLKHAPNNPVLLNNAGMVRLLLNDVPDALEYFKDAVDAAPRDGRYRANKAVALGLLGDYQQALETYRKVVSLSDAYYNVGVLCQANDDLDMAADAFRLSDSLR